MRQVQYEIEATPGPLVEAPHLRERGYVSGIGEIEGLISGAEIPDHLHGVPIELELEGGRRWWCFWANGRLVNMGGIK